MYAALWRRLPGPTWVRALIALALLLLVLAACVTWLFPWAAEWMPFNVVSVGSSPASPGMVPPLDARVSLRP